MRQYARSSEASAAFASASSAGPSNETVKCVPIACCMRSCSSSSRRHCSSVARASAVAWRGRDDSLQRGDRSGDLAEAVLHATEQHARLGQRRIQHERTPGRRPRIVVSPLEVGRQSRRRDAGARFGDRPRARSESARPLSAPRLPTVRPMPAVSSQRRPRIDLREVVAGCWQRPRRARRRPAAGEAGVAALLKLYWCSMPPAGLHRRSKRR